MFSKGISHNKKDRKIDSLKIPLNTNLILPIFYVKSSIKVTAISLISVSPFLAFFANWIEKNNALALSTNKATICPGSNPNLYFFIYYCEMRPI